LTIDGGRANAGFLDVGNLLDYMVWAAFAPHAAGQCYNVRDAYDVDWASFLRELRERIGGRGRIVDLPFGVAWAAARMLEAINGFLAPAREPMLHTLLVNMFGRTCGHSAAKIRADSGINGRVGYRESMDDSVRWYRQVRGL
jgi:nucleoside-diphosphate-sugar epimerase